MYCKKHSDVRERRSIQDHVFTIKKIIQNINKEHQHIVRVYWFEKQCWPSTDRKIVEYLNQKRVHTKLLEGPLMEQL